MRLRDGQEGKDYRVVSVNTDDEELNAFLLSLGCYAGQIISLVTVRRSGCVVSIKDGRYNVDKFLAAAIEVEQV